MVQVVMSSPVSGLRQLSQSPVKASKSPSGADKKCGTRSFFSPVHSKNPLAGMMQRRL